MSRVFRQPNRHTIYAPYEDGALLLNCQGDEPRPNQQLGLRQERLLASIGKQCGHYAGRASGRLFTVMQGRGASPVVPGGLGLPCSKTTGSPRNTTRRVAVSAEMACSNRQASASAASGS